MNGGDRLQREALQICMDLVDVPVRERDAEVRRRSLGNEALRSLVMRLLGKADTAAEQMPTAGGWSLASADLAGTALGGYALLEHIGSGGMGSVYLAERLVNGLRQRVAVKVMAQAAVDGPVLSRFMQEQQVLARLHHPYISTFIDSGLTDAGVPFLVMEYIDGEPIGTWCRQRQAGIEARIDLWLRVCEAVAHAHRNLIVHRDIKPANVLVTGDGLPKLPDFGIAKLLDAETTTQTTRLARHLTIDYATPERILRNTVSTSDDIYALAVVLFELLAGSRPFNRGDHTLEHLLTELEDRPAPRLSKVFDAMDDTVREAVARERGLTARSLQSQLSGDLEAICAKALHPDPERRYPSIDAMVADVRAWLGGRPVAAAGDSTLYRVRRFVSRNRAATVGGLVSALALAAALTTYVVQAEAVQREARRAIAVNRFIEELLAAPNARWDTAWRGHADLRMSELLELASARLESDLADEPQVRAGLHVSLARAFSALSMSDRAVVEQRKAVELARRALPESSPMRPRILTTMATMLDQLRTPESIAEARRYLTEALDWFARHQPGPGFDHAATLGELGYSHFVAREYTEALRIYRDTEAMFLEAGGDPNHPLRALGVGLIGLALFDNRQWSESLPELERSLSIYDQEANRNLTDAVPVYGARIIHDLIEGRHDRAREGALAALRLSEKTEGRQSLDHYLTLSGVAHIMCETGRDAACIEYLDRADAVYRDGGYASPLHWANARLIRAERMVRLGNGKAAFELLEPLADLQTVDRVRSSGGFNVAGRWHLAMAGALRLLGRDSEALPHFEAGMQIWSGIIGSDSPWIEQLRQRFDSLSRFSAGRSGTTSSSG